MALTQTTDTPTDLETSPADTAERWFRPGLALVTVAGFVWRLIYLFTSKVDKKPVIEQGDAFWYVTTARSLSRGELFRNFFTHLPTAEHPPLTPMVLVPAAKLSGEVIAMRLTMVLLGTAVIVVVGLAGRRLAGPVAGLASALVAACLPSLWINDVLVMSETITALVAAAVIWAGIVLAQRPTTKLAAGAGALCGLAALARAETVLLLPLMVWVIIALSGDLPWSRRFAMMGVATGSAVLVMAPWIGLNLTRFEEPVALSTNDGFTLAGANCDATYRGELKGGWVLVPCVSDVYAQLDREKPPAATPIDPTEKPCLDEFQKQRPCLDPSQVSSRMRSVGLRYIADHLDEVPGVMLVRNGRVWGFYGRSQAVYSGVGEGRPTWASRLAFATTWAMFPVAVGGLVILRRRRLSLAPFLAPLAAVVVTASLFTGLTPRIRVPWDVASCLLAGVVIATLLQRYRRRGGAPEPTDDADLNAEPSTPDPDTAATLRGMSRPLIRCAVAGLALSIALVASGCGSGDSVDKSSATTAAGASSTSTGDSGSDAKPADCAALTDAAGRMYVNWQLVAQLAEKSDLSEWPTTDSAVGTLPEFAAQLDTLEAQVGTNAEAAKEIAFMRGANDIVQRGVGGDTAAPADLATYLGDDIAATLARKTAILQASADAGC